MNATKLKEISIRNNLASKHVQEMLERGKVIAFLRPEMFKLIQDSKIKVHPNLSFLETDRVESGKIFFAEAPQYDFITNQLFSKL